MELTPKQGFALSAVQEKKNVFLTGSGSNGKSLLIRKCSEILSLSFDKHEVIRSSHGKASRISLGMIYFLEKGSKTAELEGYDENISHLKRMQESVVLLEAVVLLVDCITHDDYKYLEKLERSTREVRGNDMPFGGMQVVFAGHLHELPPSWNMTTIDLTE